MKNLRVCVVLLLLRTCSTVTYRWVKSIWSVTDLFCCLDIESIVIVESNLWSCLSAWQKTWLCAEERAGPPVLSTCSGGPTVLSMETLEPSSHRDRVPTPLSRKSPGGLWICWTPTSSPPSPSPTGRTVAKTGCLAWGSTLATLRKIMADRTQCEWKTIE